MTSKERPIIFSGPMVRAILEGRKTQTRRILKVQPLDICVFRGRDNEPNGDYGLCLESGRVITKRVRCPFGVPGDRLWVRETWAADYEIGENSRGQGPSPYFYRATDTHPFNPPYDKWRSPLFMKRIASRITLEITDVRVQRLQDISEPDARAEGMKASDTVDMRDGSPCYTLPFQLAWRALHGIDNPKAWSSNPWVWAITFKRVLNA